MSLPKVTIIIPTYNREQWVLECLEDSINQTYPDLKIVLIDDASSDQTYEKAISIMDYKNINIDEQNVEPKLLVSGKVKKRPDIMMIAAKFNKNYGPSFARNYGIKTAWESSDIFAFFDSDDRFHPRKIELSVKLMMKNFEHIGVVYTDYYTTHDNLKTLHREFKKSYNREWLTKECIVSSHSIVSKLAFAKCGLYDESLRCCEDWDMWLRISENFVLCHLPQPLVTMRVGEHDSSHVLKPEYWNQCYQKVMDKLNKRTNR